MQSQKQKFTKNYIECIMKNQNYILPIKSCELNPSGHQSKKNNNGHLHINTNQQGQHKIKYQLLNIGKINKIFEPNWQADRNRDRNQVSDKNAEQQKLIEIFLKKNQQIAASLLKQKKSMSDYIYSLGKDKKFIRYQQQTPSNKNIINMQLKNRLSYDRSKAASLFPKINQKTSNINHRSIEYQQTQIVIIRGQKQEGDKNEALTEEKISLRNPSKGGIEQPSYSDVTNVNIKKFLRLKQHAYDPDQGKNFNFADQLLMKKKKVNNHKKKLAKKQKQYIKNSLQQYLETKLAPRQRKVQSIRTSCKGQNLQQLLQQNKQQFELTARQTKQKQQQVRSVQQQQQIQKTNPKNHISLQKSKKRIGINAKISKKNLFQTIDPQCSIYQQKIRLFRQFIFMLNTVHKIFDPVVLSDQGLKNEQKYRYFVGRGNNRQLVKALMKRRFWWVETEDINEAHFVWTQLKVNTIFEKQYKNYRVAAQFYEDDGVQVQQQKNKTIKLKKPSNIYKATLPQNALLKIMTAATHKQYQNFIKQVQSLNVNPQKLQVFQTRKRWLPFLTNNPNDPKQLKIHNHFQYNYYIGNKKALYYNLKKYCQLANQNLFEIVPLTFHIGQEGVNGDSFKEFLKSFRGFKARGDSKNIWIVKPGENSNRGNGISVFKQIYEINKTISTANKKQNQDQKGPHTFIIQKYIQKPLLYKGRKFDIRHYMLATRMYGKMRLYFFGEGYVRTSSSDFDLSEIDDNQIHLTNDAIQKYADNYGKYEQANKISYTELQRYIDITYPNRKYSIANQFYPKIKQIALKAFKSCYLTLDPQNLAHNFQIFGLDFMIDSNFHIWLIEVNTNPCLELSSNLLSRIIPTMLQHSLRLTIDPLFPPPCHYANSIKHLVPDNPLERLQYELVFDEARDGRDIENLYKNHQGIKELGTVGEDQDTFDNDGKEVDIDIQ